MNPWNRTLYAAGVAIGIAGASGSAMAQTGHRPSKAFTTVATLDVGLNPHQISFSPGGAVAFVAAAGSDMVTVVDGRHPRVLRSIPVEHTPLGAAVVGGGTQLLVSRFQSNEVIRMSLGSADLESIATGDGPSLFAGPVNGGRYLVSVERANKVMDIDPATWSVFEEYPTGRRPFPPAVTTDGRLAFVPNYDDGTVTTIDLWNRVVLGTTVVGERPSGGVVFPNDFEYAVAVRGENKVVFVNTVTHEVVGEITDGIGDSPFSVVLTPNGRLAFVNNTASHDISVIDVEARRVVARLSVGEIPIVMAVHPTGSSLWVSSEGSDELTVISIPARWRGPSVVAERRSAPGPITEVLVMGMIHGGHRQSETWGLDDVRETIVRIAPDVICVELPPDRWERIWTDYVARGVFEDSRVRVFPEYTDVVLPMAREGQFLVEPCAGWSAEMNNLRRARIQAFNDDPLVAEQRTEYDRVRQAVLDRYGGSLSSDDPYFIHSEEYDRRMREYYTPYDETLNDLIGPGGWTNINAAHMRWVNEAIDKHKGKRILVTFGGAHKYMILDALAERNDVRIVDVAGYLPRR